MTLKQDFKKNWPKAQKQLKDFGKEAMIAAEKGKQEFKKNWPKAQKQFEEFGKEALVVAEKGKKELVRFSKESKLRLNLTSCELKKEHLYYLIGKEYIKESAPAQPGEKLKKLIDEVDKVEREQKTLKEEISKKMNE